MTALTRLAMLRMEEAALLATPCVECGHPLKQHPLYKDAKCSAFVIASDPAPERSKVLLCQCKGFREYDDQLAL